MNENYDATVWDEDEMLMPEGGLSVEDLSSGDSDDASGDDHFAYEESSDAGGAESTAPTTEQEETAATGDAATDAPTTEQKEEAMPTKMKFKAKIDRKDQDVELDFDELPGVYQRAQNYDRLHKKYQNQLERLQQIEALSAQLGYESIDDMIGKASDSDRAARIQALIDEGTSEKIAADFVDRDIERVRALKKTEKSDGDDEDSATASESEEKKDNSNASESDFKAQVAELFRLRPELRNDLKTLPESVVKEVVENNTPLRIAFAEWEAHQLRAENERIRKEKDIFAAQAETASRAPVRGAADRADDKGEKEDPWLKAFNDEW